MKLAKVVLVMSLCAICSCNGPVMDNTSQAFDDTVITEILNQIGTSQQTLLLTHGTWKITESITIPSNVNLKFEPGAVLDITATKTVTINGSMEVAGINQIFTGKGKVLQTSLTKTEESELRKLIEGHA